MKRLFLFLTMLCPAALHAQGGSIQQTFINNVGRPLAGISVRICVHVSSPANSPCNTTLATLYDNIELSGSPIANPTTTDALGNLLVYLANGTYDYTAIGNGFPATTYTIGVANGTGISSVGNLPPLFTSSLTGTALTFNLSNTNAHTFFGNNTGSSGSPTNTAFPGSDTYLFYNSSGAIAATNDLLFNHGSSTLSVNGTTLSQSVLQLGSGSGPEFAEAGELEVLASAGEDLKLGQVAGNPNVLVIKGDRSNFQFASGGSPAILSLNDGTTLGFQGPFISGKKYSMASLPACAASIEGSIAFVIDGMSLVWGDVYAGGGTDHVALYCNGTDWRVFAK